MPDERFMRHHYGASGYVPPNKRKDTHMTVDERIEKLAVNQTKMDATLDKLTELVQANSEAIGRLERIAGVLLINDEELDRRLTELEGKARRKPQ